MLDDIKKLQGKIFKQDNQIKDFKITLSEHIKEIAELKSIITVLQSNVLDLKALNLKQAEKISGLQKINAELLERKDTAGKEKDCFNCQFDIRTFKLRRENLEAKKLETLSSISGINDKINELDNLLK